MIELRPYASHDGIPTFRDSDIKSFYDRMVSDGTVDMVLYDGVINSTDEFLHFIKYQVPYFFVVYKDNETMGITWLNNIELKRAHFHFCGFSASWGESAVDIARETVDTLIMRKDGTGDYIFNVFIGIVPSFNQRAIDFLEECGGNIVGEIPYSIWSHKNQKSMPGTLIYYVREEDRESL